ncbi:hypothetical protein CSUI_006073 [Cystoisospora suis]|uniref:Uncharacterized protein n=1 Tax=Cystoisospora suis TaxID=483139 RepID=A0A2C6KVD6_9APIC|nr:hypothetical protein CSUI_006073 [Cystoisospora suis]
MRRPFPLDIGVEKARVRGKICCIFFLASEFPSTAEECTLSARLQLAEKYSRCRRRSATSASSC